MLVLDNLSVALGKKTILNSINYTFQPGVNYVIVGPNGIGKSTLLKTIAGFPDYSVKGRIILDNQDVTPLSLYERARKGIIYLHQNLPPKVAILGDILNALNLNIKELEPFRDRLVFRELSGGEGKLVDFLISYNLNPKVLLIDEIDSGLDKEKVKLIANYLTKFRGIKIIVSHSLMLVNHLSDVKFLTMDRSTRNLVEIENFNVSR